MTSANLLVSVNMFQLVILVLVNALPVHKNNQVEVLYRKFPPGYHWSAVDSSEAGLPTIEGMF